MAVKTDSKKIPPKKTTKSYLSTPTLKYLKENKKGILTGCLGIIGGGLFITTIVLANHQGKLHARMQDMEAKFKIVEELERENTALRERETKLQNERNELILKNEWVESKLRRRDFELTSIKKASAEESNNLIKQLTKSDNELKEQVAKNSELSKKVETAQKLAQTNQEKANKYDKAAKDLQSEKDKTNQQQQEIQQLKSQVSDERTKKEAAEKNARETKTTADRVPELERQIQELKSKTEKVVAPNVQAEEPKIQSIDERFENLLNNKLCRYKKISDQWWKQILFRQYDEGNDKYAIGTGEDMGAIDKFNIKKLQNYQNLKQQILDRCENSWTFDIIDKRGKKYLQKQAERPSGELEIVGDNGDIYYLPTKEHLKEWFSRVKAPEAWRWWY